MKLSRLIPLPALIISLVSLQACTGSTDTISCDLGNAADVTVSGKASYERVNLNSSGALDFSSIDTLPVRKATVRAMCGSDVIDSTTTDVTGAYSLKVPGNSSKVYIQVKAELLQTGTPGWDVAVSDVNSSQQLIYSMEGGLFDTGIENQTRNLLAKTGWNGSEYASARVAAPFAILDTVYDAIQLVLSVDPTASLPPLDIKWGPNSTEGTYYQSSVISVLGSTSDSDEFDAHVIAHEWGHYLQDMYSRDDSIGGQHTLTRMLDIRLAFSEGFGNAFSAMVTGDPVYKDSQSVILQDGFWIDLESNNCSNDGWYNECSVQSVLYDIYDTAVDSGDLLALGFEPIYDELTTTLKTSNAFTSLFTFVDGFKANNGAQAGALDTMLLAQSINTITDEYGSTNDDSGYVGELKTATNPVTPVYTPVGLATTSFTLCNTGENEGYNGYGVNRFAVISGVSGPTTFIASLDAGGLVSTDPDLYLYEKGKLLQRAINTIPNSETLTYNFDGSKEYVLVLQEYNHYAQPDYNPQAFGAVNVTCFTVSK